MDLPYPRAFLPHFREMTSLKNRGFAPKIIYDIGSLVFDWSKWANEVFPEAEYYYFDASSPLEEFYKQNGIKNYNIDVLGSEDGKEVDFYESTTAPWGNSYYKDNTICFKDIIPNKRITRALDSIVQERGWPRPDLVKIDVQGCEMDIIKGAMETFKSTKYLIVEMQHANYNQGAPKFDETGPWLESLGWRCISWRFGSGSDADVDADYLFVNTNIE
jgi:FkbM family methyltransferase